ncbi:hypothetical protein [Actinomyces sp. HMT897]|uniref:hypothetical protein n=1 Tax=Actinomyces sp. HMT897 TaxID=2789424 RepID=UPI00190B7751|nr:hypothetical protein [Actinomyces sp. HMT897]QQO78738.1 hypothetical protein JJJ15_05460 [Actinomyces sp. HMT897]
MMAIVWLLALIGLTVVVSVAWLVIQGVRDGLAEPPRTSPTTSDPPALPWATVEALGSELSQQRHQASHAMQAAMAQVLRDQQATAASTDVSGGQRPAQDDPTGDD